MVELVGGHSPLLETLEACPFPRGRKLVWISSQRAACLSNLLERVAGACPVGDSPKEELECSGVWWTRRPCGFWLECSEDEMQSEVLSCILQPPKAVYSLVLGPPQLPEGHAAGDSDILLPWGLRMGRWAEACREEVAGELDGDRVTGARGNDWHGEGQGRTRQGMVKKAEVVEEVGAVGG